MEMIEIRYSDFVLPEMIRGAEENREFDGFLEDYHVLHVVLRANRPKSVFEIGTNCGKGTSIICNAVPFAKVYSLDLPTEMAHISLQHPISEGKGDRVGHLCKFPYTQLRGDSMEFDFSKYPCEAYFIDGEHSTKNVEHETYYIMKDFIPKVVIWHDTDMSAVMEGILNAIKKITGIFSQYNFYRIIGTRMSVAIKK